MPRPGGRAGGAGLRRAGLHGDLEQRDRDQVLIQFANRSASVLVATDVAAQADIANLACVINVDVSADVEQHVHPHRPDRPGRRPAWP